MPLHAADSEKWRPTADLMGETPGEVGGLRTRKAWQTGMLHSSSIGSKHGEMALRAFEKAPFCATFC
jgi:hypothetical protein